MPRIIIHDHPVFSFDFRAREKYWGSLSQQIRANHGDGPFTGHIKVEEILIESFTFFVQRFEELIAVENTFTFFKYIFWLNEESFKLYRKLLSGLELHTIDANEFATYRRILKNILEQGCINNLTWGGDITQVEANRINEKLQELLYLGTWMYQFAEEVALQKMIEECQSVYFDGEGLLVMEWQHHYGSAYHQLFPDLLTDYAQGTFDANALPELIVAIENNFHIEYGYASGIIFEAKRHHNPAEPELQTIEPYILPANLSAQFGINQASAESFYNGLTLSAANKMTVENLVLKPYSLNRYMYRPILVYTIEGIQRALVGVEKFSESMVVLATNAIHWNNIPVEWASNRGMQNYINKKSLEHDRILEDRIEEILKEDDFYYTRNIKSFKQPGANNINIDNSTCGEIDFIIVDSAHQRIIVADTKYNRAKYEATGYRSDYSNFFNIYETKLELKRSWVEQHLIVVQEHLKIIYNITDLDLTEYTVEGAFFINTPTFYMFNGNFKAVTLSHLRDFIRGTYAFPIVMHNTPNGIIQINHPYFRKPQHLG